MRIASSTVNENIIRQIQSLSTQQSKYQSQIASGQRITLPSDDPAAVGRVLNLQAELTTIDQYSRNADRALELNKAAYSGLQQIKAISDRASEIGTLGASTASADAANAYAAEVDQLIEQAVQLGSTRFRNDYIFAGTAVDTAPIAVTRDAAGAITGAAYAGNTDQAAIALSDTTSIAPGTTGATNQGIADFLNQLVALRDALKSRDTAAVSSTQTALVGSEDLLVSAIAEQGAVEMRIEVNQSQQKDRAAELQKLVSAEVDADLPSTVVKLNQAQTAYQAALQSAANIMKLSLLDYIK